MDAWLREPKLAHLFEGGRLFRHGIATTGGSLGGQRVPTAMTELAATPTSEYFDKPVIDLGSAEVMVFCCLKNEAQRIPYFLEYYRNRGIEHFFIIDNASHDGSSELLKAADDVHYFYTEDSYRGASAGRLWLQELCQYYGMGKWCLTVDVDELLVYPASELVDIPALCSFLDYEGAEGLFTVFLDMFSDLPLNETVYQPGQPFGEVCRFYEVDSYRVRSSNNAPFVSIQGGPRGRSYEDEGGTGAGPQMKKVPLVKMKPGFSYIFSTHSHKAIRLSRITGALLHYKFFGFFIENAKSEAARGDRRQPQHYVHYANTLSDGTCFFGPDSREYSSSRDLLKGGIIRSNQSYRTYVTSHLAFRGDDAVKFRQLVNVDLDVPDLKDSPDFSIAWISRLWPLVNVEKVEEHFGRDPIRRDRSDRIRFLRRARNSVRLLDITDEGLTVFLDEWLTCAPHPNRTALIGFFGQEVGFVCPLDFSDPRVRVDERAISAQTFKVAVDWPVARFADGPLDRFALHLIGEEAVPLDVHNWRLDNLLNAVGEPLMTLSAVDIREPADGTLLDNYKMDGVIERVDNDVIFGWVKDFENMTTQHPVVVRANGRLVDTVRPGRRREDLDFQRGDRGAKGFAFACPVPLGYFFENEHHEVSITATPLGLQQSLRHSPVVVGQQGWFRWDAAKKAWVPRDAGTPALRRSLAERAIRKAKRTAKRLAGKA